MYQMTHHVKATTEAEVAQICCFRPVRASLQVECHTGMQKRKRHGEAASVRERKRHSRIASEGYYLGAPLHSGLHPKVWLRLTFAE